MIFINHKLLGYNITNLITWLQYHKFMKPKSKTELVEARVKPIS